MLLLCFLTKIQAFRYCLHYTVRFGNKISFIHNSLSVSFARSFSCCAAVAGMLVQFIRTFHLSPCNFFPLFPYFSTLKGIILYLHSLALEIFSTNTLYTFWLSRSEWLCYCDLVARCQPILLYDYIIMTLLLYCICTAYCTLYIAL